MYYLPYKIQNHEIPHPMNLNPYIQDQNMREGIERHAKKRENGRGREVGLEAFEL